MGMTGVNIRHEQARQMRLPLVEKLYTRSYTARQIQEEVKKQLNLKTYALNTAKADIAIILEEWKQARIDDRTTHLHKQIKEAEEMKREEWGEWERSKTEGLGSVAYLAEIRHNSEHVGDLLQLSKTRLDINFGSITVNVGDTAEGKKIKQFVEGKGSFDD